MRKARATVTSGGTRITITTKELGAQGSVQVVGGTAATAMGWPTTSAVGAAGLQTVTFTAEAATLTCSAEALYALSDGMTLDIAIDGGAAQTVTFATDDFEDIAQATASEVAAAIAAGISGGGAETAESDAKVVILSATHGTDSTIEVTGGTANAVLVFPPGAQVGSGSFAKLHLSTATEVRDYLNANLSNVVSVLAADDLRVRLVVTDGDKIVCSDAAAYVLAIAARAQVTSAGVEPFLDLTDGQSLTVKIDGGSEQSLRLESTVTTDVTGAPAEFIAELLDGALQGASATTSADGTQIVIRSDTEATTSSVQVTGGSANRSLSFPVTQAEGAGIGATSYAQGLHDEAIEFELFDAGVSGWSRARIWVTTGFTTTFVYDSTVGAATGWTVTQEQVPSPGAGVDDVWRFSLAHTTSFVSDELVSVRVLAENNLAEILDETWAFYAEDSRRPFVHKIAMARPRKLRLHYNEPMHQGSGYNSSVYFADISGRVSYHKTYNVGGIDYANVIVAPTANFDADTAGNDVAGLFIGSWGAHNAVNNGSFKIVQRLAADTVQVDAALAYEEPADPREEAPPTLILSPYRVLRTDTGATIRPTAAPIVLSASAISETSMPAGDDPTRFVDLELIDDLTPNAQYNLEATAVTDVAGNTVGSVYPFTSWQLKQVPNREWDLWSLIPAYNKDKDSTQDLERFIKSLDESAQLLLHDVDQFGALLDPLSTKDAVVDVMLESLGNPLRFVGGLDLDKKRDLLSLLVPMYKLKGTAKGVENAVQFFIGKTVTVVPWVLPADTWTLGSSVLGYNAYIGPSKSYVRYSFRLQHTEDLTDTDKSRIEEIVDFIRPAHTHFVGYLQV